MQKINKVSRKKVSALTTRSFFAQRRCGTFVWHVCVGPLSLLEMHLGDVCDSVLEIAVGGAHGPNQGRQRFCEEPTEEAVFLTLAVEVDRPRLCGLLLGKCKLMMVADFQTMQGLSVAYLFCVQ